MYFHHRMRSCNPLLPSISYIGFQSFTNDSASYSTINFSIGDANSNRLVVVCVHGVASLSRTINSVSIGGSVATEVVKQDSVSMPTGIYRRLVTSGTTSNASVSFAATMNRAGISAYVFNFLNNQVPSSTDFDTGTSSSGTLTTTPGGICLFAGSRLNTTLSWSNLTPDYNTTVESSSTFSGGAFITSNTSQTDTITGTQGSLACAFWR